MSPAGAWFSVALPAGLGGSALAVIHIGASESQQLERTLVAIGAADVGVGEIRLRRIAGVDEGVVARVSGVGVLLMPHGGELIVEQIARELIARGLRHVGVADVDAETLYPEAADRFEAFMLETLSRAASPLAIEALLAQPTAWRTRPAVDDAATRERSRVLRRLVQPPVVAAIGYSNVGKSTLLNAMARRAVSVVSPEAGTTRDHVGATLELGGLVVHWIDTPGLRSQGTPDAIEAAAFELAVRAVAVADLVVLCGDREHGFAPASSWGVAEGTPVIPCGTRCDLGRMEGAVVQTAAESGVGIADLGGAIRQLLVPREVVSDPAAWFFHERLRESRVAKGASGRYC